jgi:hypothetical protein
MIDRSEPLSDAPSGSTIRAGGFQMRDNTFGRLNLQCSAP